VKEVSFRLILCFIAGILGSTALAQGGGPPVPDGCTFARGRTVCTTVETTDAVVVLWSDCSPGRQPDAHDFGGTPATLVIQESVTRTTTTTTVTHAGASSIVRATDVVEEVKTFERRWTTHPHSC
jgi:hypothetical protein